MDDIGGACLMGMLIFGALTLAALLGSVVTSASWANDCKKLGSTHHNGTVYECKVRP